MAKTTRGLLLATLWLCITWNKFCEGRPQGDIIKPIVTRGDPGGNEVYTKHSEDAIKNATPEHESPSGHPEHEHEDQPTITVEGDIIGIDMAAAEGNEMQMQANAISDESKRWKKFGDFAYVPYKFWPGIAPDLQKIVRAAMDGIEENTCVRFVKHISKPDFVYISSFLTCFSAVGKQGGQQRLSLGGACKDYGIAQHELLHTLGLFHEQSRSDRDQYVTVHKDNLTPDNLKTNFQSYSDTKVSHFDQPYDFNSIMHYGAYDFAIDKKKPTIEPKEKWAAWKNYMGQRKYMSDIDIEKINLMYKCDERKRAWPGWDFNMESNMFTLESNNVSECRGKCKNVSGCGAVVIASDEKKCWGKKAEGTVTWAKNKNRKTMFI